MRFKLEVHAVIFLQCICAHKTRNFLHFLVQRSCRSHFFLPRTRRYRSSSLFSDFVCLHNLFVNLWSDCMQTDPFNFWCILVFHFYILAWTLASELHLQHHYFTLVTRHTDRYYKLGRRQMETHNRFTHKNTFWLKCESRIREGRVILWCPLLAFLETGKPF